VKKRDHREQLKGSVPAKRRERRRRRKKKMAGVGIWREGRGRRTEKRRGEVKVGG